MSSDIVKDLAKELFITAGKDKKEYGKLTDEVISALNCLFQGTLLHAFDLLDREFITKLRTPSHREVFQVKGSSGIPYFCFQACDYCTCASFIYSVLLKRELLMCKHLLAMHLAIALEDFSVREITDQEYVAYVAYETESPIKKEAN
eukprot:gene14372-15871_t